MIVKEKSGLNFEINKEDFTAKVISSPSVAGDVLIPSFIYHKSQKYFIKNIGKDSFKNNTSIESINFPEDSKVNSIESDAFVGSSIKKIYLPPSLEDLEEGWCRYIHFLTEISISPNNKRFSLIDQMIVGKSDPSSDNYDTLYYAPRNIKTATIPPNIKYINSYAFANCIFLSTINFHTNSELEIIGKFSFYKASIDQITIPDQVRSIQNGAFYKCSTLRRVNISSNSELRVIEEDAFFNSQIERIFIPAKLEELKEGWCRCTKNLSGVSVSDMNQRFSLFNEKMIVFKSDLSSSEFDVLAFASRTIVEASIPPTIKRISPFAFSNSTIQRIEFEEDSEIETIEKETFSYSSITEVRFPKSVRIIGEGAFMRCNFLSKVEFPEDSELRIIESKAFSNSSIQSLNIPPNFVEFRGSWCGYTPSFKTISISPNNRRFCVFGDKMVIGKSGTNDDDFDSIVFASRDIELAIVPPNIKYIGQFAFNECSKLKQVEIGRNSKLEEIESEAFSNSSIKSIYIPRRVLRIGRGSFRKSSLETIQFSRRSQLQYIAKYAFSHTHIKSITIPASVTTINDNAFEFCSELQSIDFSKESELSMIGKDAFFASSIQQITIPKNVENILDGTFSSCLNLKRVEFADNSELRCICEIAFFNSSISSIFVPSKVKRLKEGWCKCTSKLNRIYVSGENKYFKDLDGQMVVGKSSIMNDNYDTLYFVSREVKDVVIPSFIKHIKSYCLSDCDKIFSLKIEQNSELESIQKFCLPRSFDCDTCDFDIPKDSKFIKIFSSYPDNNLITSIAKNMDFEEDLGLSTIDALYVQNSGDELIIPSNVSRFDINCFNFIYSKTIKVSPNNKYFKYINDQMLVGKSDINQDEYDLLYFVRRDSVEVNIPSYIKEIKPYALNMCSRLQNVEFEANSQLKIIGKSAFASSSICEISIPDHVQIIDEFAFKRCGSLKTVNFSRESELKYIGPSAFYLSQLTEITIPKNVESICSQAFGECRSLSKIEFAEGSQLKSIKQYAFAATLITKLNLPPNLKDLCDGWNSSATELKEVSISPDNNNFKLLDGEIIIGKANYESDHYDTIYFASRDIEIAFIPSYIKRINKEAFFGCSKLQKVEIEANSELEIICEYAFQESSITEISLPESVRIIEFGAFQYSSIQKINIPSQITEICPCTFVNSKLAQVEIPSNSKLILINDEAFDSTRIESIRIPSNVQCIKRNAFNNCYQLKTISFEENSSIRSDKIEEIGSTSIENILIPDNIEVFCYCIFNGCFQLKSIEFTENSKLTTINKNLISCSNIEDLCIPPKVMTIDDNTFSSTFNLKNIKVSPNNKYFKYINDQMLVGKSDIKQDGYDVLYFVRRDSVEVNIPSYIKQIKPYALCNCYHLQNVEFEANSQLEIIDKYSFSQTIINNICIPDQVRIIEEDAFDNCPNLTNVVFAKNSRVKIIGKYSFAHTPIEEIIIPKSVERICERAFSDCLSLEVFEIEEDSDLQNIGSFAFSNTPISKLAIPSKVKELDRGWCRFTTKLDTVTVSPKNRSYVATPDGKYVLSKTEPESDNFDVVCFASRSIEDVFIPRNIKRIESYAFTDCKKIDRIIFSEGSKLESIGCESFSFSSIKNVTFPKSTQIIEKSAFMECKNIHTINFDENSKISFGYGVFTNSSLNCLSIPKGNNEMSISPFGDLAKVHGIEFLGDDLIINSLFCFYSDCSLILSFPNAKRIKIRTKNSYFDDQRISLFITPKAQVKRA